MIDIKVTLQGYDKDSSIMFSKTNQMSGFLISLFIQNLREILIIFYH